MLKQNIYWFLYGLNMIFAKNIKFLFVFIYIKKPFFMKKISFLFILLFVSICNVFAQQFNSPQPSPAGKISQKVGLAEASVSYSRPSMKGRTIFGDIVVFDKVWRTGANSPTKIKFDDEVMFGGTKVPAGEYTLLSIPSKSEWSVMLNKDTKGNGAFTYQESDNIAVVKVKPATLSQNVETFTIQFGNITNTTMDLEIMWEKTAIKVEIKHEIQTKMDAQIKKILDPKRDAGTFYGIASYYYENNQNTQQALELITKSTDMTPRYWTMHLKAKIQARLNDKTGAIASAEKSKELATADKDDNYVRLNDKLIAELKGKAK